jgi:uncharacterized protein (DUF2235 family)
VSKNILIYADGTGQAGGLKPDQALSNVYKLYRATRTGPDSPIDPGRQVAFYDAGLGTDADSARIPFRFLRTLRKFASSATGVGITHNIVDCYAAILKDYEPGDRIYLFGFSRGAYTARCVAGVINLCGVPTQDIDGDPLPRYGRRLMAIAREAVQRVYEHGAGKPRSMYEAEREEKARRFRAKYGAGSNAESNAAPYFIGVFDTVAALGARGLRRWLMLASLALAFAVLPSVVLGLSGHAQAIIPFLAGLLTLAAVHTLRARLKIIADYPSKGKIRWHLAGWRSGFYDRFLDKRIQYARHALAIDELRADFARVEWGIKGYVPAQTEGEPEWFQQIWFAGDHSDIGGGYSEDESRLSDVALQWMVEQAESLPHPVEIDHSKLYLFPSAMGMQHCEVEHMLDRYPAWVPARWRRGWDVRARTEVLGAPLHPSVLERFSATGVLQCGRVRAYRPEALRHDPRVAHLYAPTDGDSCVAPNASDLGKI